MISIKINKTLNKNQIQALMIMNQISKLRAKCSYTRKMKNGNYSKNIFMDFTEGYICDTFNLERAPINNNGFDAMYKNKCKIQIKEISNSAPTITKSRVFDFLITVKLSHVDFSVTQIGCFPKEVVLANLINDRSFRCSRKNLEKYILFSNGKWNKSRIVRF